jgi:hypothetical protein
MFSPKFEFSGTFSLYKPSEYESNHYVEIYLGTSNKLDKKHNDVYHKEISISDTNNINHEFIFYNKIENDSAICIDLFATVVNHCMKKTIVRIATATIFIKDIKLHTFKLYHHAANIHKADFIIEKFTDINHLMTTSTTDRSMESIESMIDHDLSETKLNIKGCDNFMNSIRLPPFMTRTKPIIGVSFFDFNNLSFDDNIISEWLNNACHRHNIKIDNFISMTNNDNDKHLVGEILSTVCTIYSNSCTYVGDFVWDGKIKKITESFENIGVTLSGDCEDLTYGILQVYNYIHNRTMNRWKKSNVDALTDVSRRYTCVATLGEVTQPSVNHIHQQSKQAHMWCMLIPKNYLNTHTIDNQLVPLLLEGTARVDPNISSKKSEIFKNIHINPPFQQLFHQQDMTFYKKIAHLYESQPLNGDKYRTMGYSVVSEKSIDKNEKAIYGIDMSKFISGNYRIWQHPKLNENVDKISKQILDYEHPSISINVKQIVQQTKQNDSIKYMDLLKLNLDEIKILNYTKGRKTIHECFFISIKKLSQQSIEKFIGSIKLAEIKVIDYSIHQEYNNILCIKLESYDE